MISKVLSDSLYFMNPAAKVKVEGLKLLQFCIPGLKDQVRHKMYLYEKLE